MAGSYREAWDLAYPTIVTMVSQTVMWTVDSAMVGRIGKVELAAVGLGGLMVITLYAFFMGLSYSLSTHVAQNFGARKYGRCGALLSQGVYLAIASGVILLIIREFNPLTIDLLGPSEEVRPLAVSYSGIRMLSAPFFILHYFYSNFFRGIGNMRTPMKVAIVANVVNIVLDYFMIFGKGPFPQLGVEGAAWATSIANVIFAATLATVAMTRHYRDRYETHRHWRPNKTMIKNILNVGTPIGVHYFLDIGSFLIFSAYVGRMGTDQLAANQIVIQILALSFMPVNGFAVAATTLMGQYIGASQPALARISAYKTLRLGLIFAGILGLIYVLFPEALVRIFNDDAAVVYFGKRCMLLAAIFQFFDATQMIAAGALRGAGDTRFPMIMALGGGWFLFLPLAYVCGTVLDGGVVGAWIGGTAYVLILAIGMFLRLKTDRWQRIRIIDAAPTATSD
jgi:MATE family multidrug resistance protein